MHAYPPAAGAGLIHACVESSIRWNSNKPATYIGGHAWLREPGSASPNGHRREISDDMKPCLTQVPHSLIAH